MKCFRYFSFVLFALLGAFSGSFIINQNNTYAIEDLVRTIDSSNYSAFDLCNNTSSVPCSSYHYLLITADNFPSSALSGSNILLLWDSSSSSIDRNIPILRISPALFSIQSSDTRIRFGSSNFATQLSPGWSVTFTLSENNPYASGITPSGSIDLTENGTYDVTDYAEAVVNVSETDCSPGAGGNYHEDLVAINNSIMICAATCLVIYFFYCIYRMIIKNSGVK